MKVERRHDIDIAKGIGIILVILGHIEFEAVYGWKEFVASFHMPLFFFISGILFNEADVEQNGFWGFVKDKASKLMIPYFVWGLIYTDVLSIENLLRLIWGNNKLYGSAGLWFLPTMLVAVCVCYFLIWCYKNKSRSIAWTITVILLVLSFVMDYIGDKTVIARVGYPFSLDIGILAGVFVYLGWGFNRKCSGINFSKWKNAVFSLILLGITWVISIVNYRYINDSAFDRVVMARGSYGSYPLFFIGAVIGSIGILFLVKSIGRVKLLEFIGQNSLVFMVTNHFSISIITEILTYLKIDIQHTNVFIIVVAYLIFSIAICSLIAFIIMRYIPILGGKKYVNKY